MRLTPLFPLLLAAAWGCGNPYRTHFVAGVAGPQTPVQRVDLRRLDADGFDRASVPDTIELGRAEFVGRFAQPEDARRFASEIGATHVLLNIEYDRTRYEAANFPRTALHLYTGPPRQRITCRHRPRFRYCRCVDPYHSYSPAYDYEVMPVSLYRHRAVFLRDLDLPSAAARAATGDHQRVRS